MDNTNRRIAKNTLYLYGRMMLTAGLSLYTVRLILETLGVVNYGIYNVVGGIVVIFGFINGAMTGATSRFLNYDLGIGDSVKLKKTFSTSLCIHIGIALLLVILGETIGLWYVNHQLTIPPDRMAAANWAYQLSLLATIFTIIQTPYMASVMSHEDMDTYAIISILNVVLKFVIVLALVYFPGIDNLILYAALFACVALIVLLTYISYCLHKYSECRLNRIDKDTLKSMLTFSGWDIYGNMSYTLLSQGIIIILNKLGGAVLNAAGGITMQVSGTLTSFIVSLISASRPQIIQQYAQRDFSHMLRLMENCTKYCFLLMGVFLIPILIEIDYILSLWLVEVPEFTAIFCRLALIASCADLANRVCLTGIHATGNVARMSIISGSMYLIELPMMYFIFKLSNQAWTVYTVHIIMLSLVLFANSLILKHQMPEFRLYKFWRKGILMPAAIIVITFIPVFKLSTFIDAGFSRFAITTIISTVILAILTYALAIDSKTRQFITDKLTDKFKK